MVDGLLMLVSAFFINKEAYRSKKWPILGFAFSAVSIFFGGGFIIGFLLGMGGAFVGMGASMKSKKLPVDNADTSINSPSANAITPRKSIKNSLRKESTSMKIIMNK